LERAFDLIMPAIEAHYRAEDATPEDNYALENIISLRNIGKRFQLCSEFTNFANKCCHAKHTKKGITLGTIHAAKGTEYKNVYLIDCRADQMPHGKGDPGEEDRIFLVAISRPMDKLRISWCGTPSPYLRPYLPEEVLLELQRNSSKVEKLQRQNRLF
jgi:superfamily I DNA/RNA helicase